MAATGFSILLLPILKTVFLALLIGLTVEMMICCTGLFVVRPVAGRTAFREDERRESSDDPAGFETYRPRSREWLDEMELSPSNSDASDHCRSWM